MVNRTFTENLSEGKQYFGVSKGSNSRFELGASLRSYFKFELINLIKDIENLLTVTRRGL